MDYMGNDIVYSCTHEKDIRGITTLFNVAEPRHTRSVQYWQWSNYDVPFGKSLSVVAKVDNRVIAHYSIMPMDFFVNGQPSTIGFGQQAVAHKKFRNLKIMKTLANFIFEEAKREFPCIYAFPNDDFFLVKKRLLGWQEIDVFYADVIPVRNLNVYKNSDIEVKELQMLPEIDWFENKVSFIAPCKTVDYLNWRFINHPINHYIVFGAFHKSECVGYLVLKVYLRKGDNTIVGHFVDFDSKGKDESVLSSLVFEAGKFFRFHGIEEIVFWNKEVNFKDFFQKFITGQGFKTNMSALVFDKNLEDIILHNEKWSFTMAVSDAF